MRSQATTTNTTTPTSTPPIAARAKSPATYAIETPSAWAAPIPAAAIAVRSETRAVASLSSDSPSRIVTMRRGSPIRRPMAVAATASGGATTAPIANASGHPRSGSNRWTTTATPAAVNTTSPTDSSRIGRRLAVKSTREVCTAAAYSSGGSSPSSTTSGSRWISGITGRNDPATPTTISSSGGGTPIRPETAVPVRTTTVSATRKKAISTRPVCPASSQAGCATQSIGSPHPSSSTPCRARANVISVRRWAAKVSTWAIIPP